MVVVVVFLVLVVVGIVFLVLVVVVVVAIVMVVVEFVEVTAAVCACAFSPALCCHYLHQFEQLLYRW